MKELAAAYLMKQDDWRLHQLFAMNFVEERSDSYAEQEYIRAIKLNPSDAELYYQLSRLLYTEQRFNEALAASSRAITISPNYAQAYDNLGLCYEANGDIPHAIDSFSRAINLTERAGNTDPWPYINFAILLTTQSPGAAIPLLKQAIAIEPQNADANYYLGRSLRQIGQVADAQGYFEKTIEIDPDCKSAYYALSTLLRAHDPDKSGILMRRFEELRSRNPAQDHAGSSKTCNE
jgi:tetratricopeptide (TPR) repeat protein